MKKPLPLVLLGLTHYAWVERTAVRRVKAAAPPLA
jgi:hypothetical protein